MIVKVFPGEIAGSLQAPSSKSAMQRACAAALLRQGTTVIKNPGRSNDDQAALRIISDLGAEVEDGGHEIIIKSAGVEQLRDLTVSQLDCGESGLSMRMFASIAAINRNRITLQGHGTLVKRPMHFFEKYLPTLGVAVTSNAACPPLTIEGPLQPRDLTVDGSTSSQYITGLLMAYAATYGQPVRLTTDNLTSRPYVDLTLDILQHFGLPLPVNHDYRSFEFTTPPPQTALKTIHYSVEGDWSGAAFLLVAGAIQGRVSVAGLQIESSQADKAILDALALSGANMTVTEDFIVVESAPLKSFEFDATHCPDLFPPLAILAACSKGVSTIYGANRLTHKESHRGLTIQSELGKLGVKVTLEKEKMLIEGVSTMVGGHVDSHGDHRIAMACSIAALRSENPVTISRAEAINKSYPDFFTHLQMTGIHVDIMN